jgi:hypothetical protein
MNEMIDEFVEQTSFGNECVEEEETFHRLGRVVVSGLFVISCSVEMSRLPSK